MQNSSICYNMQILPCVLLTGTSLMLTVATKHHNFTPDQTEKSTDEGMYFCLGLNTLSIKYLRMMKGSAKYWIMIILHYFACSMYTQVRWTRKWKTTTIVHIHLYHRWMFSSFHFLFLFLLSVWAKIHVVFSSLQFLVLVIVLCLCNNKKYSHLSSDHIQDLKLYLSIVQQITRTIYVKQELKPQ